jgi:hypothetical protein
MENIELGRLIVKQAETHPGSFNMLTWCYQSPCGTAACIAGHALLLCGYEFSGDCDAVFTSPDGERFVNGQIAREAQRVLGMTDYERWDGADIFYDFPGGLARLKELTGD